MTGLFAESYWLRTIAEGVALGTLAAEAALTLLEWLADRWRRRTRWH